MKTSFCTIILSIFVCQTAFCQNSPAVNMPAIDSHTAIVKTTSHTPAADQIVKDDFVVWELEMAENGYAINKSLKNKIRLLNSYEKIVGLRCMPDIFVTLTHAANPQDEICKQYIAKTLDIDAGNPVAICAQSGIESSRCKKASDQTQTKIFDPNLEKTTGTASLDEVLSLQRDGPAIQEESDKLINEIEQTRSIPYNERSSKAQNKLQKDLARLLNINCKNSRVTLNEKESPYIQPTTVPTSPPAQNIMPIDTETTNNDDSKKDTSSDTYAKILAPMAHQDAASSSMPKSTRSYQISENCNSAISRATQADPYLALSTCYQWGFYSWKCINALKLEEKRPQLKSSHPNKSNAAATPSKMIDSF